MNWYDLDPPGLVRTVEPAVEPISLDEFKLHSAIEIADDDALCARALKAAREYCEETLGQSFITQTWTYTLDRFPPHHVRLPRPPLISVSGITYKDTAGVTQTLSSAVYEVDSKSRPGRVGLVYNQYWPAIYIGQNVVTITYTAGYGADGDSVPERIKLAIAQLASHWLENRETVTDGRFSEVPLMATKLLDLSWQGTY